jgi:hypothetical protein
MNVMAEILREESENLAEELKQALIDNRQDATGRTRSQIQPNSGDTFCEVLGPHHVGALEYGRGPTQQSGDGSLYNRILEWVMAKGVIFQDGIINSRYSIEERTAKTITYFIHKEGTYHYKKGETFSGVRDPISTVFSDERIMQIVSKVNGAMIKAVTSEILKGFNQLSER